TTRMDRSSSPRRMPLPSTDTATSTCRKCAKQPAPIDRPGAKPCANSRASPDLSRGAAPEGGAGALVNQELRVERRQAMPQGLGCPLPAECAQNGRVGVVRAVGVLDQGAEERRVHLLDLFQLSGLRAFVQVGKSLSAEDMNLGEALEQQPALSW